MGTAPPRRKTHRFKDMSHPMSDNARTPSVCLSNGIGCVHIIAGLFSFFLSHLARLFSHHDQVARRPPLHPVLRRRLHRSRGRHQGLHRPRHEVSLSTDRNVLPRPPLGRASPCRRRPPAPLPLLPPRATIQNHDMLRFHPPRYGRLRARFARAKTVREQKTPQRFSRRPPTEHPEQACVGGCTVVGNERERETLLAARLV